MPAYFDERQRAATLLAAQMAGLPRVQLLQGAHAMLSEIGTRSKSCQLELDPINFKMSGC